MICKFILIILKYSRSLFALPLFLYFGLNLNLVKAQSFSVKGQGSIEALGSNTFRQPFYFWSNKLEQVNPLEQYNLFTHFNAEATFKLSNTNTQFFAGINTNLRKAGDIKVNLAEVYGGFQNKYARLTAGLFTDSVRMEGLSASNSNFLVGQNSLPHPRLRLGTNRFIPIGQGNFAIAGYYEDGVLNDHRVVRNARLHHKNLFFRHGTIDKLEFTWGIEHFSFWGGKPDGREQYPQKPINYIRAVLSLPSPHTDALGRKNVVGNQLGQYIFTFRKEFLHFNGTFQIAHMFEDFSGMAFVNYPDNIYTVYFEFKESRFMKKALAEFTYTLHQSGDDIDKKTGEYRHLNGRDNYFSHSGYASGFTYFGNFLGNPLFGPVRIINGYPHGPENNRFYAFHLGGMGNLHSQLEWKTKLTFSRNFGTYAAPYKPVRSQFFSFVSLTYQLPQLPLHFATSMAYDNGNLWTGERRKQAGVSFAAGYRF